MENKPLIAVALVALGATTFGACSEARADRSSGQVRTSDPCDEVHWTIAGPQSVVFDWRGGGASIAYWQDGEPPRNVTAGGPRSASSKAEGPLREATIQGLSQDRVYHYRIDGDPAEPENTFRTPPRSCAEEITFVAEGDIGASRKAEHAAAVQKLVAGIKPRFVLALGDLSYADGDPTLLHEHFHDVMVWSRDAAYMPAWGNHEWQNDAGELGRFKARFGLPHGQASPGAPSIGCCGEDWSWFDYGCLRLISYPEPYAEETWKDWAASAERLMREAEQDASIRYVVTFGHRPAFSSAGHGGDDRLRQILGQLAARFDKYVLNLAGHKHGYERSRPKKGVVHVTAGTGGARLARAQTACGWAACQPPRWSRFRALRHGILVVKAGPDHLDARFVCGPPSAEADVTCAVGETLDQFTVSR